MITIAFLLGNGSQRLLIGTVLLICCGCGNRAVQLRIFLENDPVQAGILSIVPADSKGRSTTCKVFGGACELRGDWTGLYSCTLHASSDGQAFSTTSSSEGDGVVRSETALLVTDSPPVDETVPSHALQVDFRKGVRVYDLRFTAAHALGPADKATPQSVTD